jgi:glutamate-1-semialdehyde 2,1-aminomutase
MDHILPAGKVFQAGTLSGNPLATAAGIATLRELKDNPPYEKLERLSARLAAGLCDAAKSAGVPHVLARVGSMLTLFFRPEEELRHFKETGLLAVSDWESASRSDTKRFAKYFWELIERGVYMPCSQYEALFVSAAHSEADVDATIGAVREALKR